MKAAGHELKGLVNYFSCMVRRTVTVGMRTLHPFLQIGRRRKRHGEAERLGKREVYQELVRLSHSIHHTPMLALLRFNAFFR